MNPKLFAAFIRKYIGNSVEQERPRRATVTAITNRADTGEIEATCADGHKIYIHAATVYDVAIGDEVYVQKQQVGLARARYTIGGYHKSTGGSYVPTVRAESIVPTLDSILTDDSGYFLTDDSDTPLTED